MIALPLKLVDLEPEFHRYVEQDGKEYLAEVSSVAEAQGIWFVCPACLVKNQSRAGTHMVDVTFAGRGVADHQGTHSKEGRPSRWQVSGNDFTDLTLSPSVDCGCWHGFIQNGVVT